MKEGPVPLENNPSMSFMTGSSRVPAVIKSVTQQKMMTSQTNCPGKNKEVGFYIKQLVLMIIQQDVGKQQGH